MCISFEYRLLRCESSNPPGSSDGQGATPQAVIPHCDGLAHIALHFFQRGAFTTQQVSTRFSKIAMTTTARPSHLPSRCNSFLHQQSEGAATRLLFCHRVLSLAGFVFDVTA